MLVLIQVLLLTYWENFLNKSFSFSDLTSFICKIKCGTQLLSVIMILVILWVSSPCYLRSASILWFTFSCMNTKVLDLFLQLHTIKSVIAFTYMNVLPFTSSCEESAKQFRKICCLCLFFHLMWTSFTSYYHQCEVSHILWMAVGEGSFSLTK